MAENRKLAAILAADVVGYSRLAGSDEEQTLARLRALRSDDRRWRSSANDPIPLLPTRTSLHARPGAQNAGTARGPVRLGSYRLIKLAQISSGAN